MKSVLEAVLSALNRIKATSQPIKYLVFLDENLPFVDLPGSVTIKAQDFGTGVGDEDLWKTLLQASKGFVSVLVISADNDFSELSLRHIWSIYKSKGVIENPIEVINLNRLNKRSLRSLGIKRTVAQSKRRQKIKVIKYVYREWFNSKQKNKKNLNV